MSRGQSQIEYYVFFLSSVSSGPLVNGIARHQDDKRTRINGLTNMEKEMKKKNTNEIT